ncbi:glycoside hydrolase family 5 protein [Oleiharenicola sp. Vm1]|uniref:glycoside hydrolase family 5 protein n=1 Tax=Oleiharenicola sp. Vm1 TaxID=3398393 RepID=UPI0039F58842
MMLSGLRLLCLNALCAAVALAATPLNPSGFLIHRGTNLSHWLSQYAGAPRDKFITEEDFKFIARAGFDHVRLPVDEKELWTDDGRPNEENFGYLLRALGWARAHGLRAIVDLHTVRSHHFNAANDGGPANTLFRDPAAQQHFLGLWRELSARLHDQPLDAVAYEILNEAVADRDEDWNRLVAAAHAQIRASEPARVIVIGSNKWQGAWKFPALKVPAGDPNLILSVHNYEPFTLTHYRASWVPTKFYTGPVQYPGRPIPAAELARIEAQQPRHVVDQFASARREWNAERIREDLMPAIRRARELGLQLYCGEFGCLPTVPRADRLRYYRDFVGVLESEGLAWANWDYKGNFGLFERHATREGIGAPDAELLAALFQK